MGALDEAPSELGSRSLLLLQSMHLRFRRIGALFPRICAQAPPGRAVLGLSILLQAGPLSAPMANRTESAMCIKRSNDWLRPMSCISASVPGPTSDTQGSISEPDPPAHLPAFAVACAEAPACTRSTRIAPVRRYLPHLIDLVWNGKINPAKVFDLTLPLDQVAEAYRTMDERRAITALLR